MKRVALLLAPTVLAVALFAAPLVTGARTLVLRDVLNSHLALRAYLGEALRRGELPLVDPLRAGGQPLAGNPNTLAFYPDNLLLVAGSTLWQENVHFALHWLLAILAAYWLGRAWGFGREGAAGVAAAWALSGFFFSQLNLFNAVAGAALAPALVAALLELGRETTRRRATVALGALWALMLLGGEPILAALALGAGLLVAWARHGRALAAGRLALALALGTLVAAPQLVETARVLGETLRGYWGFEQAGHVARDPRTLVDLLLPLFFGRPDRNAIWGESLFGGHPPLYFSLCPGALASALALAAGRPRSRSGWTLAALAAAGAALAYAGDSWLASLTGRLPLAGLFRYPEKFVLFAALGLAVATGAGLERLARDGERRPFVRAAALLALPLAAFWLDAGAGGSGFARRARALFGTVLDDGTLAAERLRWAGLAMLVLVTLALALFALALARRAPTAATVCLLTLHAGSQAFFLAPLVPTDVRAFYERPPALAATLPAGAVLVQGGVNSTFGAGYSAVSPGGMPDDRYFWLERRAHDELFSFSGMLAGRRYEFNFGPEGLDTFVVYATGVGLRNFTDPRRLGVLRATGVDLLLLTRHLEPPDAGGARLLVEQPGWGRTLSVYEVPAPLPPATLAGRVVFAPHMNAALEAVWRPGFDPAATAVVAGAGTNRDAPPGTARLVRDEREWLEVAVDSAAGGYLVLRRAYLPIWRAEVDGRAVRPVIAQITRLAVEVPPGAHVVRLWISRAPLRLAGLASLAGLGGLLALALARRRASDGPWP